jgi:5-methylcytosine-specific restriction endonuclease McrA
MAPGTTAAARPDLGLAASPFALVVVPDVYFWKIIRGVGLYHWGVCGVLRARAFTAVSPRSIRWHGCIFALRRVVLMPYSLHDDNLFRDPRWAVMARLDEPDGPDVLEMTPARRRAHLARLERRKRDLFTAHQLMTLETSACTSDGYITLEAALACAAGEAWQVKALATSVLGLSPWLHRKGDSCSAKNCIDSSPPWREGFDFRLCAFLKKNPSRAERDRSTAQNNDRRDQVLKAVLMRRDGPFCRYCRSGPLSAKAVRADERRKVLHRDHVDPDRPAGPDAENFVTACASCNEHKAARTPFEADMVLLDSPTETQQREWTEQGLRLFPPPWITPAITNRITDEPPPDQRQNSDPVTDPHGDPDVDRTTSNDAQARPETAVEQQEQRQDHGSEGVGSGRVGHPHADRLVGVLGQPVRDQTDPDIYHRRPRAPAGHDPPRGSP